MRDLRQPYIYKLTLLEDTNSFKKGQVYIGQANGKRVGYFTGGVIPQQIVKKHGTKIFRKEVVVRGDFNKTLLDDLEKHYIQLYGSALTGLNIAGGGTGSIIFPTKSVHKYTLDGVYLQSYKSCEDAASTMTGDKINNTYNIRRAASGSIGKKRALGFYWSYDKADCIEVKNRRKGYRIHSYSLSGEFVRTFDSIKAAAYEMGISTSAIIQALNKVGATSGGYQWKKYKVENCGKSADVPTREVIKEIFQYSLSGDYINSFHSALQGAKSIGIEKTNKIVKNLTGKAYSAHGYQWSYERKDMMDLINRPGNFRKITEVYNLDLGDCKQFISGKEAGYFLGVDEKRISEAAIKGRKIKGYSIKRVGP